MKLQAPENENYAATVVSIKSIVPLATCDNVVGTPLFGFQAVVSKDTQIGDLGIVFPAETQLSPDFCKNNNLYRHADLNKDKSQKGYIEDNRRVKAVKFRGHRSDCLFMSLDSLAWTKFDISQLKEGDTFDVLGGKEICKKYLVKIPKTQQQLTKNKLRFNRVDEKFMPKHYDTGNYFRNQHVIPGYKRIIVTQKLHGTSIRIGNTVVLRKLNIFEKALKKIGVRIEETEYDYVFGSRNVIKDINNPHHNHFYGTDLHGDEGKKLEGLIPENCLVYAELIGWTPKGGAIQKNYTYKVPHQTCDLYVYRVAFVNRQGKVIDLSWEQLKEFCTDLGLRHVPELWQGIHEDFKVEEWLDKRFHDNLHGGYKNAVPLEADSKLVDEGVCIRVDGLSPYILKAKSPVFLQHETKMMDEEAVDIEADESTV